METSVDAPMIRRRNGCVNVFMRDGTSFSVTMSDYATVRDAWMAGRTFVDCTGLYGSPVTIKLSEVNGIGYETAASWDAKQRDDAETEREIKQRELLDGDGS
jgi:hypothetical protein